MTRGTGPPPPLSDFPNGIDISQPEYTFETEIWGEPPFQFPEEYLNLEMVTARKQSDETYKRVGNVTTWNRYIALGYHVYDNCFQFDTQWGLMQKDEGDVLQFIWSVYSYLMSRSMDIPPPVDRWAIDIAKPYLQKHRPATLDVNTDDPRQARRHYDEPDLMDIDDHNTKPKATEAWTVVGKKPKTTPAVTDAIQTPLPDSPKRMNTNETQPDGTDAEEARPEITHVQLNDGTLRITVKWKPNQYDTLSENQPEWNLAATDLIHFMLDTVRDDAIIHPWVASDTTKPIPSLELNPDNLREYIAPKITPMPSMKMFVFSFRVCIGNGPGRWMNNPITKKAMSTHHVEVNISNSSSDSGDTITTAGYIFFKHPTFTHRFYYLKQLRQKLQASTPFFDIGIHRRTPTGQEIPHLVVKCGENHVSALTEILSTHLDGSATSVFLGRLLLSKMSTHEVDSIFQTHADYVKNTRILSLSPVVQNVDRIRTEYSSKGNLDRSTRTWATNLKDTKGNSLKCDAENGGDNRRAQLLVPLEHLVQVRQELAKYKESVSPFSHRENNFSALVSQSQTEEEQYTPTHAANHNLTLIKNLSSSNIWDTSPTAAARSPNASTYKPPSIRPPQSTSSQTEQVPPVARHITPPASLEKPLKKTYTEALTMPAILDDDTVTTNSHLTRSLETTQLKFKEIEDAIKKQNAAIKEHQTEFKNVNLRFDDLEKRMITTMQFCQDSSQNVLELRQETTASISGMRQEALNNGKEFRQCFIDMQQSIQSLTARLDEALRSGSNSSQGSEDDSFDEMSCHSHVTERLRSPRKQKDKRKRHQTSEQLDDIKHNLNPKPPPDQDKSAQYNENSTPDAGAK